MLIDSISTFKITAFTPLGDEDFHISLIDNGGVVGGRIWNDKGEISFTDSSKENNSLEWSIPIETPFETILKFTKAQAANTGKKFKVTSLTVRVTK